MTKQEVIDFVQDLPEGKFSYEFCFNLVLINTERIEIVSNAGSTSVKVNSHEINNCITGIHASFKPGEFAKFDISLI